MPSSFARVFAPTRGFKRWLLALVGATLALGCGDAKDADEGNSAGGSRGGTTGSGPTTSSFPDAQLYVDAHNAVRAAVEEPPGYTGSWRAVPPVAWSDEIAQSAQAWANHLQSSQACGLEHAEGTGYGENLAAGTNVDAEQAVEMWASEVREFSYSPKYVFETNTGHYTQIVWRATERIGCASAACDRSRVVVCRYDPPGNYIGQQVY